VVGGIGRVYGPLLGSAFLTFLPQALGGAFSQQMNLVYGFVLVLFILLAPEGFYGIWRGLGRSLHARREARSGAGRHGEPRAGGGS